MSAWLLIATLLAGVSCWYCGQRENETEVCRFGSLLMVVSVVILLLRWFLLRR